MSKITLTNLINLQNEGTATAAINANNAIVTAAIDNALYRVSSSPNEMQSTIDMNSNRIINLVAPVTDYEPVRRKEFMETLGLITGGYRTLLPVSLASTGALPNSPTYLNGVLTAGSNGALSLDSTAVTVGTRVLIKDQATQAQNGVYTVTATGSGAAAYVLTRATDMDSASEFAGNPAVQVLGGVTLASSLWAQTATVTTVGTSPVVFTLYGLTNPAITVFWTMSGTNMYNNNTGSVGIGTSSPSRKLHVLGSGNVSLGVDTSTTTSGSSLELLDAGASKAAVIYGNSAYPSYGGANSFNIVQVGTGPITFWQNSGERMRLTTTGWGINTTAPTCAFQINRDTNTVEPYAINHTATMKILSGSAASPITEGRPNLYVGRTEAITNPLDPGAAIRVELSGNGGITQTGPAVDYVGQPVGVEAYVTNETGSKSSCVGMSARVKIKGTSNDGKAAFGIFADAEAVAGVGLNTAAIAAEFGCINNSGRNYTFDITGIANYFCVVDGAYASGNLNGGAVGYMLRTGGGKVDAGFAVCNGAVDRYAFISPGFYIDNLGGVHYTTTLSNMSDMRLKNEQGFVPDGALDRINQLKPRYFSMKDDPEDKIYLGFFAQEVGEVIEYAMGSREVEPGKQSYTIDQNALLTTAIKAIQELKQEVDQLKEKLNDQSTVN